MGLWDGRVKTLDNFARGIADLNISRNPLSSEVVLIFNEQQLDQYQDSRVVETSRAKKYAMVYKNPDIHYVQELGVELLMDSVDQIPWLVHMTTTGLPRLPRFNDCINIDGVKYTISMVKPLNRNINSLIQLIVYPERTHFLDPLEIIDISVFINNSLIENIPFGYDKVLALDVLYKGFPVQYSFDNLNWLDFKVSKIPLFLDSEFGAVRALDGGESDTIFIKEVIGGEAYSIPLSVILEGADAYTSYIHNVIGGDAQERDLTGTGDAYLQSNLDVIYDGMGAWDNYFTAYDGGFAKSSYLTLYLRDKEGNVVYKEI